MERMILKHLSGSKANQIEEFALKHHNELILGREIGSTVKFDPDRDDLVGRQHAKIMRDPNDPNNFLIADMDSRNGTFVNRQKISGAMRLNSGDSVQLGLGGPEFLFEVEPRPFIATKATRISDLAAGKATPETRVVNSGGGAIPDSIPTAAAATAAASQTKPAGSVGKATVERMIVQSVSETKKSEGRKYAAIGGAAILAVLLLFGAVVGGAYYYNLKREQAREQNDQEMRTLVASQQSEAAGKASEIEKKILDDKAAAPIAASEIADRNNKAIVQVETAWRLIHPVRKTQVYHLYLPQVLVFKLATKDASIKGMIVGPAFPVYVQTNNGKSYEPVLVEDKEPYTYSKPIGSVHSGSGFFVTNDGFILTNRHVAATWKSRYNFDADTPRGIVLSPDYRMIIAAGVPPPLDWVPANSRGNGGVLGALNVRVTSPLDYTGVNDYLKVAISGKDRRLEARLVEASDRHDAALMKVDQPGELTKVELDDNYDTLKKGESVVIMGYPSVTPDQWGFVPSQDMFNPAAQMKTIANPTVTTTSVSNILRSNTKDQENMVFSEIGDAIQLSTASTGPGNSGGPVFDAQGRVIGIYFAYRLDAALQYAVPIRYGKQLLNME